MRGSADGFRSTQQFRIRGNSPATPANILHGRHFGLAHMSSVDAGGTAETAFFTIIAGLAKVPRRFGQGTASITGIGHGAPPFKKVYLNQYDNCPVRVKGEMAGAHNAKLP
jgi:hypothetical protein